MFKITGEHSTKNHADFWGSLCGEVQWNVNLIDLVKRFPNFRMITRIDFDAAENGLGNLAYLAAPLTPIPRWSGAGDALSKSASIRRSSSENSAPITAHFVGLVLGYIEAGFCE